MMRWFLMAVLLLVGCSKPPGLVVGGDFEPISKFEGVPTGWSGTYDPATAQYVTFEWDREISRGGDRSISIAVSEDHSDTPVAYNWSRVVNGWEVGGTYELEGWIKADQLNETAWIVVQCWNLEYEEMVGFATTQAFHQVWRTTDWVKVGAVLEIPLRTEQVRIRAGIAAPDNAGGKVWFDDIELRKVR